MLQRYPSDVSVFASGAIQNELDLKLCVNAEKDNNTVLVPLELKDCGEDLDNPGNAQNFILNWRRETKKKIQKEGKLNRQ
jgi:hypothetical protein